MFEEPSPASTPPDALLAAYLEELGRHVSSAPKGAVSEEVRTAVEAEDGSALDLAGAATVLALGTDRLDARAIEAELRDRLLIGMTNAVLDVDTLAREIPLDRSGKELQQAIEGRAPMTLLEYAHVRHALAQRAR